MSANAPVRPAASDSNPRRLSFAFAKRHGVLVNRVVDGVAECTYRENATPQALAEVRRYLRQAVRLERVPQERFDEMLRQAYEAWKINKLRFDAGRIPITDYAQSRQQFELFRGQRITALDDVLEKERQLRGFMGLPVEDGTRLVPVDEPKLAPYQPDWYTAELPPVRRFLKRFTLKGPASFGWLTRDLSVTGTIGDPRAATIEKGQAILDAEAALVADLMDEALELRLDRTS